MCYIRYKSTYFSRSGSSRIRDVYSILLQNVIVYYALGYMYINQQDTQNSCD